MKSKILLIPALLLFIIAASSFVPGNGSAMEKNERIEVIFTRNMKINDLVKVKSDLEEQGITLSYKLLRFDDEDRLSGIAFKVDCHDGFKGSASNTSLRYDDRIGFYRDYRPGSSSPFGTGKLTEE